MADNLAIPGVCEVRGCRYHVLYWPDYLNHVTTTHTRIREQPRLLTAAIELGLTEEEDDPHDLLTDDEDEDDVQGADDEDEFGMIPHDDGNIPEADVGPIPEPVQRLLDLELRMEREDWTAKRLAALRAINSIQARMATLPPYIFSLEISLRKYTHDLEESE